MQIMDHYEEARQEVLKQRKEIRFYKKIAIGFFVQLYIILLLLANI